jgi:transmembrane sensor
MQMPNDDFSVEELTCNESFQHYCLGSGLENQILWNEWINARPARAADFEEARKIVDVLSAKQGSKIRQLKELRSGIKQREFLDHMLSSGTSGTKAAVSPRKTYRLYQYAGAAAAAAVIIFASLFLLNRSELSKETFLFAAHLSGRSISSGSVLRKTVFLSDGTLITLGKESTIRLTKNFNSGKRELWLSGEAFFDVKHDPAHPFVVHTSFNDIRVLGTTFNVKAYPNSDAMETALIRGSVRVYSKKYAGYVVTLKPNEKLITYDRPEDKPAESKPVFKVSAIKHEDESQKPAEIQWVRNRLDIENEPLSAIAGKLQKWYGIEIRIRDESLKNYRYSGVFENENVIKTLEALQLSYPFQFKVEQDKITISK